MGSRPLFVCNICRFAAAFAPPQIQPTACTASVKAVTLLSASI